MRKVAQIMGLPISVDIPGAKGGKVFGAVFSRLRQIDGRFSAYKKNSEVSQLNLNYPSATGVILVAKSSSEEMRQIVESCLEAEKLTNGYFSAWYAGHFDPSGYVKGWAIAEAGKIIEDHGYKTYCLGAGGDILARSNSGKKWQIAIQDPGDQGKILDMLSISNGAVATSGNYARGQHIYNPKNHQAVDELLSVTVIGPDIIWADVLATACFAMGKKAADFIKTQSNYTAVIVQKQP